MEDDGIAGGVVEGGCQGQGTGSGLVGNWMIKGQISDWLSDAWRAWRAWRPWRETMAGRGNRFAQRTLRTLRAPRLTAWRMMRLGGFLAEFCFDEVLDDLADVADLGFVDFFIFDDGAFKFDEIDDPAIFDEADGEADVEEVIDASDDEGEELGKDEGQGGGGGGG